MQPKKSQSLGQFWQYLFTLGWGISQSSLETKERFYLFRPLKEKGDMEYE